MIKTAVILDAGRGTKLWPYAQLRSKGMIPVGNKPVLRHQVDALRTAGVEKIIIVGGAHAALARNHFRNDSHVTVIEDKQPRGSAFSLLAATEHITGDFIALHGDCFISPSDIQALVQAKELPAVLVSPIGEKRRKQDFISCSVGDDRVHACWGHPRSRGEHFAAGFAFAHEHLQLLSNNSGLFTSVEVGAMPAQEGYIEMSVNDYIKDGGEVLAVHAKDQVVDIDKPWHILEADHAVKKLWMANLTENQLAEGASIHPTAYIDGVVVLDEGSSIGRNCTIEGKLIVGKNTKIDNGAILRGENIIGDNCTVRDGCLLESSTLGHKCYVGHGAEMDGVLFNGVYLFHYMEICGVVGENTDIGAATVCGTLRFDDGQTRHRIKGRLEGEHPGCDGSFIGDYCRTGVNAILMPGVKMGVYSICGAGVMLQEDLPDNTLVYAEQTLHKKPWGPEKYGW
ncbi:MAG: NTP transferase domain-containing protein [Oscillospiraceae bacterium]|nr:NTP transferase domain-containing protein [Oscillospiraceae bacterium]